MKFLSNTPKSISSPKDDFLGTIAKADTIKHLLDAYRTSGQDPNISTNKIFALWGEWGSGKTTLSRYLQNHLNESGHKTVFFESWKYEVDDNLPLSLLECLTEELPKKEKYKDILKESLDYFRAFVVGTVKGISIKAPGAQLRLSTISEEVEKTIDEYEKQSFAHREAQFRKSFVKLEKALTDNSNDKWLYVFIDDLDRCNPEGVINLLSSIKLFFTYGHKTVFFIGLDKKAVQTAIEIQYGESLKAEEYLEKIIDATFTMPTQYDISALIRATNPNNNQEDFQKLAEIISNTVTAMGIKNMRKINKIINKYNALVMLKKRNNLDVFPNIYTPYIPGSELSTYITVYAIALSLFHEDLAKEIIHIDGKISFLRKDMLVKGIKSTQIVNSLYAANNFIDTTLDSAIALTHKALNKGGNPGVVTNQYSKLKAYGFSFLPNVEYTEALEHADVSIALSAFKNPKLSPCTGFAKLIISKTDDFFKEKGLLAETSIRDIFLLAQNII